MRTIIRDLYINLISNKRINIFKTIYINLKLFSLYDAFKFPIVVYGPCKMTIKGQIQVNIPLKKGILKIGYWGELINYNLPSQFRLLGTLILKGKAQLASAVAVYVREGAVLEVGHLSYLGAFGNLICTKHIVLSDYSRVGAWSVVTDSNYHYMKHPCQETCRQR